MILYVHHDEKEKIISRKSFCENFCHNNNYPGDFFDLIDGGRVGG